MNNKHQKFSSLALAWIMLGSVSLTPLTSCKDYDDDINNLQSQIDKNKEDIKALQDAIKSGALISKVESIEGGYKISFSGTTAPIEIKHGTQGLQGPKGEKGDPTVPAKFKVVSNVWMVSIDGGNTWAEVTNEAGEPVKVAGKDGKNGNSITVDENGVICTVDGTTGAIIEKTDYKFLDTNLSSIIYDDANNLVVIKVDGKTYSLPTVDALNANLTEIKALKTWNEVNASFGVVSADFTFKAYEGDVTHKKGDVLSRGAYIPFIANPTAIDLTKAGYVFSLVPVKGAKCDLVTLVPVKGLPHNDEMYSEGNGISTSRAISPEGTAAGVWSLDVQLKKDITAAEVASIEAAFCSNQEEGSDNAAIVATNAVKKSEVMSEYAFDIHFGAAECFQLKRVAYAAGEDDGSTPGKPGFIRTVNDAYTVWENILIPQDVAGYDATDIEAVKIAYREIYKDNLTVDKAEDITIARDANGMMTFKAKKGISDRIRNFTYSYVDYKGDKHEYKFKVTFNDPFFEMVDLGEVTYKFGQTGATTIDATKLLAAINALTDTQQEVWDANANAVVKVENTLPAEYSLTGLDVESVTTAANAKFAFIANPAMKLGKYVYTITYGKANGTQLPGVAYGSVTFTVNVVAPDAAKYSPLTPRQGYFTGTVADANLSTIQYVTNSNVTDMYNLQTYFNEAYPSFNGIFGQVTALYGGNYVFVDETAKATTGMNSILAATNGSLVTVGTSAAHADLFNSPRTIAVYFVKDGVTAADKLDKEIIRFTFEFRSSLLPIAKTGNVVSTLDLKVTQANGAQDGTVYATFGSEYKGLTESLYINDYTNATTTTKSWMLGYTEAAHLSPESATADGRFADIKVELKDPANKLIEKVEIKKIDTDCSDRHLVPGHKVYGFFHQLQLTAADQASRAVVQAAGTEIPVIVTVTDKWGVKDVSELTIKVMPKDI